MATIITNLYKYDDVARESKRAGLFRNISNQRQYRLTIESRKMPEKELPMHISVTLLVLSRRQKQISSHSAITKKSDRRSTLTVAPVRNCCRGMVDHPSFDEEVRQNFDHQRKRTDGESRC